MRIIKPYAKITPTNVVSSTLSVIEAAARISHRSENLIKEASAERFVRDVIVRRGDWSVVEHVTVTVEFLVDRGVTHELVRHRLFSYTQESTRFVNYVKKMPASFVYPIPGVQCEHCLSNNEAVPDDLIHSQARPWLHKIRPLTSTDAGFTPCLYEPTWLTAIQEAEDQYRNLIDLKWPPQSARSVFPNALASKLWITGNLRNWRHFFLMRTTKEAHPQMREVTIPLLTEFKTLIPVLFEDIEPGVSQLENVKKAR